MELPSIEAVTQIVTLLVPGIIILGIRTRAIAGTAPDLKGQATAFAVVSVAYLTFASRLFNDQDGVLLPFWLWTTCFNIIAPAIIGILLSYCYQYRLVYKFADLIGLKLFHHLPTAWDYTFESIKPDSFVLVELNDGRQISGQLTANSFISSTKDERDILIGSVYNITSAGEWVVADPARSILLCGRDIRWIEIF